MKIEFKNQKLKADIDVKKEWPLLWHRDENEKKVSDLSMEPGKIHLEMSGDVTLDTGSLKLTDVMSLIRVIAKLDRIHSERIRQAICEEMRKDVA